MVGRVALVTLIVGIVLFAAAIVYAAKVKADDVTRRVILKAQVAQTEVMLTRRYVYRGCLDRNDTKAILDTLVRATLDLPDRPKATTPVERERIASYRAVLNLSLDELKPSDCDAIQGHPTTERRYGP